MMDIYTAGNADGRIQWRDPMHSYFERRTSNHNPKKTPGVKDRSCARRRCVHVAPLSCGVRLSLVLMRVETRRGTSTSVRYFRSISHPYISAFGTPFPCLPIPPMLLLKL